MSDSGKKGPSRLALDPETDAMLEDYCDAGDESNRTRALQKAVRLYILTQTGRNEGLRERYVDLQLKRAKQRADAANSPSTDETPDGEKPPKR